MLGHAQYLLPTQYARHTISIPAESLRFAAAPRIDQETPAPPTPRHPSPFLHPVDGDTCPRAQARCKNRPVVLNVPDVHQLVLKNYLKLLKPQMNAVERRSIPKNPSYPRLSAFIGGSLLRWLLCLLPLHRTLRRQRRLSLASHGSAFCSRRFRASSPARRANACSVSCSGLSVFHIGNGPMPRLCHPASSDQ